MQTLAALCKDQAAERAPMDGQLERMMALRQQFQIASGLQDYVNYGSGCIDGRHLTRPQFKAEFEIMDQGYSSLHNEMFNLSAGDWFMKAAIRKEQALLEDAISIPKM